MGLNVLSLFDGMSVGQLALKDCGIEVDNYYASEIKSSAKKVTMSNFPNTIQIGDVTKLSFKDGILFTETGNYNVGKIDLLIGGSPCQDFSMAKGLYAMNTDEYGLDGEKSKLFYEYLRLKNEVNPTYFLLENVKMKKDSELQLNKFLGVDGIHINSNLVSFQNRKRIYWTNIPRVTIPDDLNIDFQNFKDTDFEYCKNFKLKETPSRIRMWNNGIKDSIQNCPNITNSTKVNCLTRKQDRCPNSGLIEFDDFCRYLTRRELELAQTLPIGYCDSVSYLQMQDLCGDGWTMKVISHLFKGLLTK